MTRGRAALRRAGAYLCSSYAALLPTLINPGNGLSAPATFSRAGWDHPDLIPELSARQRSDFAPCVLMQRA
jgi:hypothetical protein